MHALYLGTLEPFFSLITAWNVSCVFEFYMFRSLALSSPEVGIKQESLPVSSGGPNYAHTVLGINVVNSWIDAGERIVSFIDSNTENEILLPYLADKKKAR